MRALLVCPTVGLAVLVAALLATSPHPASAQMKLSPKATAPGGTETRYFTSIDGLMDGNADVILKETRQGKTLTAAVSVLPWRVSFRITSALPSISPSIEVK